MIASWHILGAGAIGSLVACKFKRAGIPVRLLPRLQNPAQAETRVITLVQRDTRQTHRIECAVSLAREPVSHLLITTKANDAVNAFASIRDRLSTTAQVVLLHNGMGTAEQIAAIAPTAQLYCGVTTEAAHWNAAGELVHAGIGDTCVGQTGTTVPPGWFADWHQSGERFAWEPDIERALWKKLIINCAINPLTAIYRCDNGALLENPQTRRRFEAVCDELANITRLKGYPALADDTREICLAVVKSTAANQSSMMRDIAQGRTTEIEYITGYLYHWAEKLNVPCPQNQALLSEVRGLQKPGLA